MTKEVRAAGAVILKTGADGVEVLVVHRPRYDDWSFPKGKLERGETWTECARREIAEEAGFEVTLDSPLPDVTYRDRKKRPKRVKYWRATVVGGEFVANDEVDVIEWLSVANARERLTYERDIGLLDSF